MNAIKTLAIWPDLDFWEALLVALLIAGLALVWAASRSNKSAYSFVDVMNDDTTGKASFRKLAGLVALIATTWAFLKLVSYHELPEWYAQLYFVTWALVLMIPQLAGVIAQVVMTMFSRGTIEATRITEVSPSSKVTETLTQPASTGGSNAQPNA